MNTSFKLLDNKPVWAVVHMEGRSEITDFVAVNDRFKREAYLSGDKKFIKDMERIIKKSEDTLAKCGVWKV